MNNRDHLLLYEERVPASGEWEVECACWHFLRLRQGQGYWLGEDVVLEMGPGDVLVMRPGETGLLRASQLGEVSFDYFLFCQELLGGLLTLGELRQLESSAARQQTGGQRFSAEEPIARLFRRLPEVSQGASRLTARSLMLQVVGCFFDRDLSKAWLPRQAFLPANQRVRRLVEQLTEADILAHSAGELAARCNCSPHYFQRLFLQQVGVSFRVKRREVQFKRARLLLAQTAESVAHVARAAGYKHPGLFSSTFKQHFGMSPGEWRRRFQENRPPASALCRPKGEL